MSMYPIKRTILLLALVTTISFMVLISINFYNYNNLSVDSHISLLLLFIPLYHIIFLYSSLGIIIVSRLKIKKISLFLIGLSIIMVGIYFSCIYI